MTGGRGKSCSLPPSPSQVGRRTFFRIPFSLATERARCIRATGECGVQMRSAECVNRTCTLDLAHAHALCTVHRALCTFDLHAGIVEACPTTQVGQCVGYQGGARVAVLGVLAPETLRQRHGARSDPSAY